eukprot:gene7702-15763_t
MAVIGTQALVSLLRILNVRKDDEQTLENAETSFSNTFSKDDHFKIGIALCMSIQDQLLTKIQRIIGFSILCDLYRSEQGGSNPFLPFFLDAVEHGTDLIEKRFLVQLLCSHSSTKEHLKKTVPEILKELRLSTVDLPDMSSLRQLAQEQAPKPISFTTAGIRPIIPAPLPLQSEGELEQQFHDDGIAFSIQSDIEASPAPFSRWTEKDLLAESSASLSSSSSSCNTFALPSGGSLIGLQPAFARPPPPLLDVTDSELQWINVDDAACILWDTSI